MERPIKFRAWDREAKTMLTVREINFLGEEIDTYEWEGDWLGFDHVVLMQFTGLYDCKRTEEYPKGQAIYEGDIPGRWLAGCYIGYCKKCKQFEAITKDGDCLACQGDLHWYEIVDSANDGTLEVIGNRWEHPELLEMEVEDV